MMTLRHTVLVVLVVLGSLAAMERSSAAKDAARTWKEGDRVLVYWPADKFWYPGTVHGAKDGKYDIVYDDGEKRVADAGEIVAEDIKVGDKVFGNFKRAGLYYPGKVTSRKADQIHIKYDDGDDEDTTIGMVRVQRDKAEK